MSSKSDDEKISPPKKGKRLAPYKSISSEEKSTEEGDGGDTFRRYLQNGRDAICILYTHNFCVLNQKYKI